MLSFSKLCISSFAEQITLDLSCFVSLRLWDLFILVSFHGIGPVKQHLCLVHGNSV